VLILKLLVPFGPESAVNLFNTVPKITPPDTAAFNRSIEQVQPPPNSGKNAKYSDA